MKIKITICYILLFILESIFALQASAINNKSISQALNNLNIQLIAPASGVSTEELIKLKNINHFDLSNDCLDDSSTFHSTDDETRFLCLKNAIFSDKLDILWVLRGGYGSAKLILKLKNLPKPQKEKLVIGYSDITALHLFLSQEWGWKTIHGPMAVELLNSDKDLANMQKLIDLMIGKYESANLNGLVALNHLARNTTKIAGKLTGGNLTVVQTSIGTDWMLKGKDKILFFEDVNVKPYQIDRILLHLQQARIFEEVKAIIFGVFDQDGQDTMRVLQTFADNIEIPVFKTSLFGHGKFNYPIIYNAPYAILESKTTNNFNLVYSF